MKVLHRVDLGTHPGTNLESVRKWWGPTKYYKCEFSLDLVVGPSGDCVVTVSGNSLKLSEG